MTTTKSIGGICTAWQDGHWCVIRRSFNKGMRDPIDTVLAEAPTEQEAEKITARILKKLSQDSDSEVE